MYDVNICVVIVGVGGCMGCQLIQVVLVLEGVQLGVVLECEGFFLLGSDVGELVGVGKIGVIV